MTKKYILPLTSLLLLHSAVRMDTAKDLKE